MAPRYTSRSGAVRSATPTRLPTITARRDCVRRLRRGSGDGTSSTRLLGFTAAVAEEPRRLPLPEFYGRPMPGTSGVHGTATPGGRHIVTMVLCRTDCVRRGDSVCTGRARYADAVRAARWP